LNKTFIQLGGNATMTLKETGLEDEDGFIWLRRESCGVFL
jgi:hypothetical protein